MKTLTDTKFSAQGGPASGWKETEVGSIPEEWDVLSVAEVAKVNEKVISNKDVIDQIEYLDIASVESGSIVSLQKMSLIDAPSRAKRILRNNDTVISTVRPNLKHYTFIKNAQKNMIGSTGFAVITPEKINPIFLYYSLTTNSVTEYLSGIAASQTSTYPAINPEVIENMPIAIPSKQEQKQIAEILSSLDDKIELNRQINANLEKIASSLFKHWFVDFEFPNKDGKPYKSSSGKMIDSELGEIPEGWRVASLGEFFPIITGKKDANVAVPNGQYPFFSCSQGILRTNEYSFDSSSILLAGNGDFNVKWYEGKFDAYQRTYILTPKNKQLLGFLFYSMKHFLDDITAGHRGSVIRFITKGMIENFKVSVPDSDTLKKMTKIFYEINQSIDFYKKEIENLLQIRDSLLPRLMNGKIRVK